MHLELEPGFPTVLVLLHFIVHNFSFGHSVSLESFPDESGNLTVCEPFSSAGIEVKRVYFLHNLAKGARRGGHAHRALHQLLIAVSANSIGNVAECPFGCLGLFIFHKSFKLPCLKCGF